MSEASLKYLIQEARKYKMTQAELDTQVRSFAYGNTHYENSAITKADIREAQESLKGGGAASNRS